MINQQQLELYIYVDGVNDVPFFSGSYEQFILSNGEQFVTSDNKVFNVRALNEDIVIHAFTYNAKRMGSAPTITTTIKYSECLDELFSQKVYATFNGEKYFLVATPSSSYSAEDIMYKHEATFVSERIALENTYYYDVVPENEEADEPVSNNSDFVLSLDIEEFVRRMNYSLQYAGLQVVDENGKYVSGYRVELDKGITSDEKFMSIENKFFSEVLQEVYNTFDLPYYFVGKEIHIGYSTNAISEVFRYGDSDALVSITKSNTNNRIINRATGIGSEDNLPYYYPNLSPKGNVYVDVGDSVGITNEDVVITNHITFANKIETNKPIYYIENGTDLSESYRFLQSFTAGSSYEKEIEKTFSAGYSTIHPDVLCSIKGTLYNRTWGERAYNVNGRLLRFTAQLEIVERGCRVHGYEHLDWYNVPDEQIIEPLTLNITGYNADGKAVGQDTIQGVDTLEYLVPNDWVSVSWTCSITYKVFGYDSSYVKMVADVLLEASPYWKYNGTKIELSDIGLQVNNTPMNGDTIIQKYSDYITPQKTLMPPIYRETLGAQRFYDAVSGVHVIPDENGLDSGLKYEFENEYNGHNPKEQIVQFEEIKPTIKEMRNSEGLRIDMFSEIAFDENDNDEMYEAPDGAMKYKHPLFFAKLRKLDFNLFDSAIDSGEMTIAMTDGSCGACEFKVAVDKDSKKNTVQVDENGNLVRYHNDENPNDEQNGDVLCGDEDRQVEVVEQDKQQDTINNEVWIALYKDKDTFGEIMPSVQNNLVPKACSTPTENDGDTFVILNISLPQAYIEYAEKQLEQQIIYFIYDNNREKFNFSVKFSRIYFAEHPEILSLLDENSRITIEYNGIETQLYVSSITYKITENEILPEITVELKDEVTVTQNQVQKAANQVKAELYRTLYGIDVIAQGSQTFLRKDQPDTALQPITFKSNTNLYGGAIVDEKIESKDYFEGVKGLSIRKDENNDWHIETDYLHARKKFSAKEVEIQKVYHISGAQIKSSASMICSRVDDIGDAYRCWFDTIDDDGNTIYNQFIVGDQAYVQTFNLIDDDNGNTTNHFYWRLVEAVDVNSIVLSKTICAEGSTIPMVGDNIVQLGYQGDDRPERQVAVIDAGAGEGAPYYRQYVGINSFALPEPETQLKPNDNKLRGRVDIKEGSLLSGVIAVKDENDDNIVAVINGADNLVDENGRKLVVAAGVTNVEKDEEIITNIEATTKIFDDGTLALGDKVGMTGNSDTNVRIWAGATEDNKDNAPFKVTQDGKVIATNAIIEGEVNATSGTFVNVEVKGSIRSPFTQVGWGTNDMPSGSDNVHTIGNLMSSGFEEVNLTWDMSQAGRKITIVGSSEISAPTNKEVYFYENGYKYKDFKAYKEVVELIGYSRQDVEEVLVGNEFVERLGDPKFMGWIVLNRQAHASTHPQGKTLTPLAVGHVNNYGYRIRTFDGSTPTFDYYKTGGYAITIPKTWFGDLYNNCLVMATLTPTNGQSPALSVTAYKYSRTDNDVIEFATRDAEGGFVDGEFDFMIYPSNTWY